MAGDPDPASADRELLTITPVRVGTATVAMIDGEIDLATGPHLHAELGDLVHGLRSADAVARVLIVDLTAVTFLGSTGLAVLVDVNWQAGRHGVALRVIVEGSGSRVARAMQAAGIHELLEIHPDLDAALSADTA